MATGTIRPEIVTAEQINGRTFFYENISTSTTVTIETLSSIVGVALFFTGTTAARCGEYLVLFMNPSTVPTVTPVLAASGISISASEGKITITSSGGTTYLSVMCLYPPSASRIKITST